MSINLHRWTTFKDNHNIDTITNQANVDHCGVCGTTPIAQQKKILEIKPRQIQSISRELTKQEFFKKHFRKNFLFSSIFLSAGLGLYVLNKNFDNVTSQKKLNRKYSITKIVNK